MKGCQFPVEKSDLNTENVAGCQIVSLLNSKLNRFIDDENFVKILGLTIKSLQVGSVSIPWYLPVLHCYHPPTGFNIMITIPSLDYLSCFALDDKQYQLLMDYHFVTFQQTDLRQIDKLIKLVEGEDDDTIQGYFSESFLFNPKLDL